MTKKRDLERELIRAGFTKWQGTKHDKFRKGDITVMVPRHKEISEGTARAIRKEAGLQ